MVIFSEHIPSQKLAILTFMQQQKALSEVANALKNNESSSQREHPLQSIFEIPRKESWMDAITKLQTEAVDYVKKSEEINEKINELHDSVEAFDDKDFVLTQERVLKSSESTLAIKRVHQLEGGDSEIGVKNDALITYKKANKILPDQRHKSKFTSIAKKESNVIVKKPQPATSTSSLSRKSSVMSVKVSPSVRKILNDAKEKHTSLKSRKEMPINTITLELK